jgi:hypothetical protein
MAEGHAKRKERGHCAITVAIQSRFHRGKPDGEPFALKPLKFHLVPNLQFVTLACGFDPALELSTSLISTLLPAELL